MRLAMAQMRMTAAMEENLQKSLDFMRRAREENADLVFFPEVQLSPFFPQYENRDASAWLLTIDHPAIAALREACRQYRLYASPNVYLLQGESRYDASLMIDPAGEILGISKMVHIAQAPSFYEQDYYTPSDGGFQVYQTPFGKIGVVICFDRHMPESIRACAQQGAELVIVPTANLVTEPMELFEWEMRVQAFQNTVFAAMCNRVGAEGGLTFAGESLLAAPDGGLLLKADGNERLLVADVPLEEARLARERRPWLALAGQRRRREAGEGPKIGS